MQKIQILLKHQDKELRQIAKKVLNNERINEKEGLYLYEKADLSSLGVLANYIREKLHGNKTFFNRNFHIEPTNICIHNCKFCSYSRKAGEEGSWEYSIEQVVDIAKKFENKQITETHIVGGVHPDRDLHFYGKMMQEIKQILPKVHIKAFTAVELDFMINKANLSLKDGLLKLKEYGLNSIPGGGAEIFSPEIRTQICGEKSNANLWLKIHEEAHNAGIPSNATMLYGHIEKYSHRIEHLSKLRELQDKAPENSGFNAFIPLKYKKKNNSMEEIGEVSIIEDLRNYAVSRIFLDNIPHIKAYWVMIGKQTTQLSLAYGVDDVDGTIDDTTKIYSMADENPQKQNNQMTTNDLVELIKQSNRTPIERDTLYNTLKEY